MVTGFGKTCIVHTSDFAHLEIHNNHKQSCKDLKLYYTIMSDCHPTSSVSAMFSYLKLRYKREVIMFYKIMCAHHTMDLPDYI